ncbi:hypothetical protein LJC55_03495, partial [Eubacteriales bacterium OttesenSCG-928-N14]|nr:hypothetical protein [Eubacteriales bacterium OttesenSCG-928-N14]
MTPTLLVALCMALLLGGCGGTGKQIEDIATPTDGSGGESTSSPQPNAATTIQLGEYEMKYSVLTQSEIDGTLPFVIEAVENIPHEYQVIFLYFYEMTQDGKRLPFAEYTEKIEWQQFTYEVDGYGYHLMQHTLLESDLGCLGYVYMSKDKTDALTGKLAYAGVLPGPDPTDAPLQPDAAYANHSTTWLQGEFVETFGVEATAFQPQNPQEGVCLLVRTDDSSAARNNSSLMSNKADFSLAQTQSNSLINGVETTSLNELSFTKDPNLASILLVYSTKYTFAYNYNGGVKGHSCVVTVMAYDLKTGKKIGQAEFKNQPPTSISVSPGQSLYYASFPPTAFETQMKSLVDAMLKVK